MADGSMIQAHDAHGDQIAQLRAQVAAMGALAAKAAILAEQAKAKLPVMASATASTGSETAPMEQAHTKTKPNHNPNQHQT